MKRVLKATAVAAGALVVLVLLVVGVGMALPVAHSATLTRHLATDPERVWRDLTTPEAFATWRPDVTQVRVLEPAGGRLRWVESGPGGSLTLEVVASEPPTRLVTRIADEGLPFGGTWTWVLEPEAGGTRLTVTEDGEIYNPVFRFVARFLLGYEGTMTTYLDALEARVAALP